MFAGKNLRRYPSVPGEYGVAPPVNVLRTVSVVAAEPNAGVTVSTALCTAECRGWPFCLGMRLSAGSSFFCLLHQGVRIRGQILQPSDSSANRERQAFAQAHEIITDVAFLFVTETNFMSIILS